MPSKNTGKTISKIKINKKDVVISFNDHSKLRASKEVLANFYIYPNKTLSYKEIKEIEAMTASAVLLKYAMTLLRKGHYSEYKIREKLYNKEGKKPDVDRVIRVLKENDLINDKMLALDLIEYGNERNLGKNKIIHELSNKGIFDEVISKYKFPASLEKKKAMNNLPKLEKKYDKYSHEQKKQHIFNALVSLGFDADVSREVINHVSSFKQKDELEKLDRDLEKTYSRLKRKYEGYELKSKVVANLRSKGYKVSDIMQRMEKKYGEID